MERISRRQARIVLLPLAVKQAAQTIERAEAKMMPALRADAQAGRQILVVDDLGA